MKQINLRPIPRQSIFLTFLLAFLVLSPIANAKVWRNAYLSYELPAHWDCRLEGTEWVCRTSNPRVDNREAIIILTAKEVGPSDALSHYQSHLKLPRTVASRTGQPLQSQVLKVEERVINNHTWIDGMHLSSEVPNYYTRYLATTKDKIAILVTFSAHKLHYSKYAAEFFQAIMSLRVIATRSMMNSNNQPANLPGSNVLGANTTSGIEGLDAEGMGEDGDGSKSSMTEMFIGLALMLGAVGFYLLMKKNQKKR